MADLDPGSSQSSTSLPSWARELVTLYESGASSQFILHGNTEDRFLLPDGNSPRMGSLEQYLLKVLLPGFDVILRFDLGNGLRVEKGGPLFQEWPGAGGAQLPKAPRQAAETITHYFRYLANLTRLGRNPVQVACIIASANLVAPNVPNSLNYDLSALASLVREWASDGLLAGHPIATFLVTENLNDLHPLIANNPRASRLLVPLPDTAQLHHGLLYLGGEYPTATQRFSNSLKELAGQLTGASLGSVESLVKTRQRMGRPLEPADIVQLKKELVEADSGGLIEFISSKRTLEDYHGQDAVKKWLRQDASLWASGDLEALPKGYLFCGPVGTGKTYLMECLAGEAGVPVVKLKNFRDKWVGSTEGNLERIFRLLGALGRCYVFIDEADQSLGRREGGGGDSGVSGRVYSMIAEEMGRPDNRGRLVWVLATSRPDLVEVDLKRPGRVDVKIPLFPTRTPEEALGLIWALCRKRGLDLPAKKPVSILKLAPDMLTPGAAEAIAVKAYRLSKTQTLSAIEALKLCLADYQTPVPADVMSFQIEIAAREATDLEFVPPEFRPGSIQT